MVRPCSTQVKHCTGITYSIVTELASNRQLSLAKPGAISDTVILVGVEVASFLGSEHQDILGRFSSVGGTAGAVEPAVSLYTQCVRKVGS